MTERIKSDLINGFRKLCLLKPGANFMQHQNTIVKIPELRAKASQPINAPFMKRAVRVQRGDPFICTQLSFIKVTHG